MSKALGHKRGSRKSDVCGHPLSSDALLPDGTLGAVLELAGRRRMRRRR